MLAVQNRAAVLGPDRFPWWKDWREQTIAIIACGPSARKEDVELLRGKMPVLAIKEAHVRLAPWCDVVYGCEAPWWRHVKGLPGYKGLKLAWSEASLSDYPDIHRFTIKRVDRNSYAQEFLLDEPGVIGSGSNSGFQALNIAAQFGAQRILLVGFDMHGRHFYGRNQWPRANNPDEASFSRWIIAMRKAADVCKRVGVDVVNASPTSSIDAFPRKPLAQALEAWGL